ncbi:MAG: hypothetical protein J2O48_00320 [Solirubrobacterales bacterium]|nr:hypothetical protein [Solirubrobacterales bacterium]
MRRIRLFITFLAPVAAMLLLADPALAVTHGGQGLHGPTDDAGITNVMFLLIGFFPVIIVVFSLIQSGLDHRKHAKWDKQKAAMDANPVKGGW